jgi:hypothetical protein
MCRRCLKSAYPTDLVDIADNLAQLNLGNKVVLRIASSSKNMILHPFFLFTRMSGPHMIQCYWNMIQMMDGRGIGRVDGDKKSQNHAQNV